MKIRKLKIVGYKVIDHLELDFTDTNGKTLDTIIFAGLNGCGKTTILEAIQSVFSEEMVRNYKRKTFENTVLAREIFLEFELTNFDFEKQYLKILGDELFRLSEIFPEKLKETEKSRKEFINSTIVSIEKSNSFKLSYTSDGKELLTDDFESFHFFSEKIVKLGFNLTFIPYETYMVSSRHSSDDIKDNESVNQELQKRKEELLRIIDFEEDKTLIKSYIINEFLQNIVTNQDTIPRITMGKIIDKVNKILNHITLNTTLKEIDTKQIKFRSSNGQTIPLEGLSSGEKQLFYRFVYLQTLEIQNSIVMVDEPETSLHPTWQQQLVKLYQSIGINNQIILATHSPHILGSVKPENIFLLNVNPQDARIEAIHLKDTDLKTKGVETNRILKEIMGVKKLMDEETSSDMKLLNEKLTIDEFDKPETVAVYERLLENLGKEDSYMVSVDFEMVMLKKMREKKKLKAV